MNCHMGVDNPSKVSYYIRRQRLSPCYVLMRHITLNPSNVDSLVVMTGGQHTEFGFDSQSTTN